MMICIELVNWKPFEIVLTEQELTTIHETEREWLEAEIVRQVDLTLCAVFSG